MGILPSKNYYSRIMARRIWKTLWHQDFQNLARAYLKTQLLVRNLFHFGDRKFHMTLTEIPKPYGEPNILAEYIALQLESRVAFRRTMKKTIKLAKKTDIRGIKIQIAGRLNGAEIARVEWAREGRVPLQTLQARIGYCYYPAQTIYGVLGIKVWIFQDEK